MDSLSLLLKPSSHLCNLRCDYCFYRPVAALYPGRQTLMSLETAERVVARALACDARRTAFCWQGGEPTLLGTAFFEGVVDAQQRLRGPHQQVENSLQTNGLLLDDDWCRFLKAAGFLVGLSLDGPAALHDRYRCAPDGSGSFARVMRAAGRLRRHQVPFNILTLITDANVGRPEALYAFYRRHAFDHVQLIPCFESDPASGDPLPFAVDPQALGRFYCRFFDLWLADGFPYVSVRLFEDILLYALDSVHASCAWGGACDTYVLVEHNGDCFPCDFFVSPAWRLGNLVETPLADLLAHPRRRAFAALKADLPAPCRRCPWVAFCNGDCPRLRVSGSTAPGRFCRSLQMLLTHIEARAPEIVDRAANLRASLAAGHLASTARNAPCPCGSAAKYKRCCGRKWPATVDAA